MTNLIKVKTKTKKFKHQFKINYRSKISSRKPKILKLNNKNQYFFKIKRWTKSMNHRNQQKKFLRKQKNKE